MKFIFYGNLKIEIINVTINILVEIKEKIEHEKN